MKERQGDIKRQRERHIQTEDAERETERKAETRIKSERQSKTERQTCRRTESEKTHSNTSCALSI